MKNSESWRSFVSCEEGVEISKEDRYRRNEVTFHKSIKLKSKGESCEYSQPTMCM